MCLVPGEDRVVPSYHTPNRYDRLVVCTERFSPTVRLEDSVLRVSLITDPLKLPLARSAHAGQATPTVDATDQTQIPEASTGQVMPIYAI